MRRSRSPGRVRARSRGARRGRRVDRRARARTASSPFTRRPVKSSSAAVCGPTRRGRVTLRPKPWWKPSRAKLALKRASGAAIRKSADRASPRPPPIAAPWTAATTGVCVRKIRTAAAYRSSVVYERSPLREVGAGTEVLARCTQHGGAAPVVAIEVLQRVGDTADLVEREEVVRRIVQLDRRDEVVADRRGEGRVLEDESAHGVCPAVVS